MQTIIAVLFLSIVIAVFTVIKIHARKKIDARETVFFLLEAEIAFKESQHQASFLELAKTLKPELESVSIKTTDPSVLIVRGRRVLIENFVRIYGGTITHLSLSPANKFPKPRENSLQLAV